MIFFGLAVCVIKMDASPDAAGPWLQKKRLQAKQDAGIKLLNMIMPDRDMYALLMRANASGTGELPEDLIKYYKQLVTVMPAMPQGYAVLGFCDYHAGLKEKAYDLFQKALLLDPHSFWTCQNLAIMTLEAGQYAGAGQLFSIALSQDPRECLKALMSSKVYRDILTADPSYDPITALEESYAKAARALALLKRNGRFQPKDLRLQVKIF